MLARLEEAIAVVPHLGEVAPRLRDAYEAFAVSEPLVVQRVHGDLHLGQVLRTEQGWVVLDFEGEPVRSIESRRARDSSLRDVAGMMRSFDYAANHQVIDSGSTPQTNYRAKEWSERNRDAFCSGYARASGSDPRDSAVLLRAFEADKAVYEAVYEARNRPAWLPVPLASLGRLSGSLNGSSPRTSVPSPLSDREAIQ
jgi:maltokinase